MGEICEGFWKRKENFRGNASKSSGEIFDLVNAALELENLPQIKKVSMLGNYIGKIKT